MLVLTRSCEQEIRIGDDIVIRVLNVKGDRVRLGVEAPPEVTVHREEVYVEIVNANREALSVSGAGLAGAQELLRRAESEAPSSSSRNRSTNHHKGEAHRSEGQVGTEVSHGT